MSDNGTPDRVGQLTDVDLREAWAHEANDFTPWLAENLDRLAQAIGVPMESEGTEVSVGSYQADILARDQDGKRVLIENQLEFSDHSHLGQILTYLAGLEARTVVWVARDFNQSHLSAVRWLNNNAGDDLNPFDFFAVRLKVVQIDDSRMVPVFEVLERPSDWDRRVRVTNRETSTGSEIGQHRREFWTHYSRRHPEDGVREGWGLSNFWLRPNESGPRISLMLAQGQIGVFFTTGKGLTEEEVSDWVARRASIIQAKLGLEVSDNSSCSQSKSLDTWNRDNWDEMTDWLHQKLQIYSEVQAGQSDEEPTLPAS